MKADPVQTPGDPALGSAGKGAVSDGPGASIAPSALSAEPTEAPAEGPGLGAMLPAATPRAVMLAHLAADMGAALKAGDLDAARMAHEAIGNLLALGSRPSLGSPP